MTHADMYKHTVVDNSGVYGYRSSTSYLLRTYLLRLSRSEFPVLLRVAAFERRTRSKPAAIIVRMTNVHSLTLHVTLTHYPYPTLSTSVTASWGCQVKSTSPGVHTRDFEDSRFAPRTATYGRRVV